MKAARHLLSAALALCAWGCGAPAREPPACVDECAPGQARCDPWGARVLCEGPGGEGCARWGVPAACAQDRICAAGECVCASPCEAGARACSGAAVIACAAPEGDGCPAWGPPEACPAGLTCEAGACACEIRCAPGELACAGSLGLVECIGPDGSGCPAWGPLAPCPDRTLCDAGARGCVAVELPACGGQHECDFVGQKVCVNESMYRECALGPDGCLELDCSS